MSFMFGISSPPMPLPHYFLCVCKVFALGSTRLRFASLSIWVLRGLLFELFLIGILNWKRVFDLYLKSSMKIRDRTCEREVRKCLPRFFFPCIIYITLYFSHPQVSFSILLHLTCSLPLFWYSCPLFCFSDFRRTGLCDCVWFASWGRSLCSNLYCWNQGSHDSLVLFLRAWERYIYFFNEVNEQIVKNMM